MDGRAMEYRARLERARREGGEQWQAPGDLREEITCWARGLRLEGHLIREIAESVGLSKTTIGRWLSASDGSGDLKRVRVSCERDGMGVEKLALVTPSGYRLEGLSLEEAVDVLRRFEVAA